jgi:hypothetical protein
VGICFPTRYRILLDGGASLAYLRRVLTHELVHAACDEEYDKNPSAIHIADLGTEEEENAALSIEETLAHVLPQLGWKLPPLPKQTPYLRRLRRSWKPLAALEALPYVARFRAL